MSSIWLFLLKSRRYLSICTLCFLNLYHPQIFYNCGHCSRVCMLFSVAAVVQHYNLSTFITMGNQNIVVFLKYLWVVYCLRKLYYDGCNLVSVCIHPFTLESGETKTILALATCFSVDDRLRITSSMLDANLVLLKEIEGGTDIIVISN